MRGQTVGIDPRPTADDVLLYASHPDGSAYAIVDDADQIFVIRIVDGDPPSRAGPFASTAHAVAQIQAILVPVGADIAATSPDDLTSPRVVARPFRHGVAALHRIDGEGWVELFSDDDDTEIAAPINHGSLERYFTHLIASLTRSAP